MAGPVHLWLRAETKPLEQRTPLTPDGAAMLQQQGFRVTVEDSAQRVFAIDDYRTAGCEIAAEGSWPDAPADCLILGLKELPEDAFPLAHRHIYFAHVYKGQAGAEAVLRRYADGGGTLYDIEYLTHANGRRVAAFGYWAGYAGAALGVLAWVRTSAGERPPLPAIHALPSKDRLLESVRAALERAEDRPTLLVIGARGRGGSAAVHLAREAGLETIEWDIEETRRGGPFREINEADVLVNCVLVNDPLPPFITRETLAATDRRLSVIVDVSCDPYGPYNPLPVYEQCTSFADPCLEILGGEHPLHLIAIDNLPSLLPRESSEDFSAQLAPVLATLGRSDDEVWERARNVFLDQIQTL